MNLMLSDDAKEILKKMSSERVMDINSLQSETSKDIDSINELVRAGLLKYIEINGGICVLPFLSSIMNISIDVLSNVEGIRKNIEEISRNLDEVNRIVTRGAREIIEEVKRKIITDAMRALEKYLDEVLEPVIGDFCERVEKSLSTRIKDKSSEIESLKKPVMVMSSTIDEVFRKTLDRISEALVEHIRTIEERLKKLKADLEYVVSEKVEGVIRERESPLVRPIEEMNSLSQSMTSGLTDVESILGRTLSTTKDSLEEIHMIVEKMLEDANRELRSLDIVLTPDDRRRLEETLSSIFKRIKEEHGRLIDQTREDVSIILSEMDKRIKNLKGLMEKKREEIESLARGKMEEFEKYISEMARSAAELVFLQVECWTKEVSDSLKNFSADLLAVVRREASRAKNMSLSAVTGFIENVARKFEELFPIVKGIIEAQKLYMAAQLSALLTERISQEAAKRATMELESIMRIADHIRKTTRAAEKALNAIQTSTSTISDMIKDFPDNIHAYLKSDDTWIIDEEEGIKIIKSIIAKMNEEKTTVVILPSDKHAREVIPAVSEKGRTLIIHGGERITDMEIPENVEIKRMGISGIMGLLSDRISMFLLSTGDKMLGIATSNEVFRILIDAAIRSIVLALEGR